MFASYVVMKSVRFVFLNQQYQQYQQINKSTISTVFGKAQPPKKDRNAVAELTEAKK